ETAVERGELSAEALDSVEMVVTPQKTTEQRNPLLDTNRNKVLFENSILGRPTWSTREGLDFEKEQEDLKTFGGPPPPEPGGKPGGVAAGHVMGGVSPGDRMRSEADERPFVSDGPDGAGDADAVDPVMLAELFYGLYGERALDVVRSLAVKTEAWEEA